MNDSTHETPPVLHGDGVTDDTAAVQWYLDAIAFARELGERFVPRTDGPPATGV